MMGTLHVHANGTPKPRTPDNPAPNPTAPVQPAGTVRSWTLRISGVLEHRGYASARKTDEPARFVLTATSARHASHWAVHVEGHAHGQLDLTKKGKHGSSGRQGQVEAHARRSRRRRQPLGCLCIANAP